MSDPHVFVELRRFASGQLQAFADVTLSCELGELTLHGFRVFCAVGQEPRVVFPVASYQKEGKTHQKELVSLSRGLGWRIEEAILGQYRGSVASP